MLAFAVAFLPVRLQTLSYFNTTQGFQFPSRDAVGVTGTVRFCIRIWALKEEEIDWWCDDDDDEWWCGLVGSVLEDTKKKNNNNNNT